jgi:hypothetical protein
MKGTPQRKGREGAGRAHAKPNDSHSLVGRWKCVDEWQTEVSLEITEHDGSYRVQAVDAADGEEAEIYGVQLIGDVLTFAAHWSSGQFTKYRARRIGDKLEVVFTYTDTVHFRRAPDNV